MLRIYFLQQWFDLSDPAAEDAIYDSESMRRFARVELGEDPTPRPSARLAPRMPRLRSVKGKRKPR
jgi:transposase, IS5 family